MEEFKTPVAGEYKLECWGAGNPYNGGGYSYGDISLKSNTLLYVCVGAKGNSYKGITGGKGGYNGGGDGGNGVPTNFNGGTGGGGATHIGFHTGLLNKFESDYTTQLLLVAGGAGGSSNGFYGQDLVAVLKVGELLLLRPRQNRIDMDLLQIKLVAINLERGNRE